MPVQGQDDPRFRGDGLLKGLGSYPPISSAGLPGVRAETSWMAGHRCTGSGGGG